MDLQSITATIGTVLIALLIGLARKASEDSKDPPQEPQDREQEP